jgi:Protein of unknown function (DUF2442)
MAESTDERVVAATFNEDEMSVRLMDGRTITVPLAWYPRLLNATTEQRKNWLIAGGGYGLPWSASLLTAIQSCKVGQYTGIQLTFAVFGTNR